MSAGPRIPLAMAASAAGYLLSCWGSTHGVIVGSVRRQRPDVGDLEVCCPVEPPENDGLFKTLHACAHQQGALFAPEDDKPPLTIVKGLKPGFKAASLVAHVRYEDRPFDLPVQVYRYEPGARAWSIIMRTGPSEFGQWFLGRWKKWWNTPPERPASVDGFLVDRYGARVPIDEELEAFRRIEIGFIRPEQRDTFIERLRERS